MSVYKSEKPAFLNRALQSVWDDQSLKPDKIVLVQDGPVGDELSEVLNQWKEKLGDNLCLLKNDINIGLTKSLIKGLSQISTKYVARMDSDDISLSDRFQKQLAFLEENSKISVVGCDIQEFSEKNDNMGIRRFPRNTEGAKNNIYKANPLAHPAVMMRKSMFDEGISYNPNYRTTQDLALWFDVLAAGYEVANLNEVLLKFRREDDIYHRRANWRDSWLELKIHERGIYKLYGLSPVKSLFPIARFAIRLLPGAVIKYIYNGKLRKKMVEG
jgi:glycosyltransferase involved in cell wall biosynthesis